MLVAPGQGYLLKRARGCSPTPSSVLQDMDPGTRLPAARGRDILCEFAQRHTAIALAHLLGFFSVFWKIISLIKNEKA